MTAQAAVSFPLKLSWNASVEHVQKMTHKDSGDTSTMVRTSLRHYGLLDRQEELTELGKQVLKGRSGVLLLMLQQVMPAVFSVGPDDFEQLWPQSPPRARELYVHTLKKMCEQAGMVWTAGGWKY